MKLVFYKFKPICGTILLVWSKHQISDIVCHDTPVYGRHVGIRVLIENNTGITFNLFIFSFFAGKQPELYKHYFKQPMDVFSGTDASLQCFVGDIPFWSVHLCWRSLRPSRVHLTQFTSVYRQMEQHSGWQRGFAPGQVPSWSQRGHVERLTKRIPC